MVAIDPTRCGELSPEAACDLARALFISDGAKRGTWNQALDHVRERYFAEVYRRHEAVCAVKWNPAPYLADIHVYTVAGVQVLALDTLDAVTFIAKYGPREPRA